MEKTLKELKRLLEKIKQQNDKEHSGGNAKTMVSCKSFLGIGLTAKKNLCVHEQLPQWKAADRVQSECKARTAEWNNKSTFAQERQGEEEKRRDSQASDEEAIPSRCLYYENLSDKTASLLCKQSFSYQVFTMEDLIKSGLKSQQCPYYAARELIKSANFIVFNYLYLLDPQIASSMIKSFANSKDTIVVFDEAHNIDDVCIEAYSLKVNARVVNIAERNVHKISSKVQRAMQSNLDKYTRQFKSFIYELKARNIKQSTIKADEASRSNIQSSLNEKNIQKQLTILPMALIPQSLSNYKLFLSSLLLLLQHVRNKLKETSVRFYDLPEFRGDLTLNTNLDMMFFRYANSTLQYLLNSLQISEVEQFKSIKQITFLCELVFSYSKGFKLVFQPHPMDGNISDPLLTLSCLDCSLCLTPIWRRFPCVILTSGTMSPIELYPRILGFTPLIAKSISIQLGRNPISPLILTRTYDQQPLSSQYTLRSDQKVSMAYGNLLRGLAELVPDGILCFFPSYMYMQHILKEWNRLGIIKSLLKNKYVFIEKKDPTETAVSLYQYRSACDIGRGAIFLAIARGKIAEGVDFEQHYGRCVIMMGFPVQNSHDPILLERIKFMVESKQIRDRNEFFEFDTMRQCAQCLGRVMRRKNDYGLMILADSRFGRASKYEKLPEWIKKCLESQHVNITFEGVFHVCSAFFRNMGITYQLNQKHYRTEESYATEVKELEEQQQIKENQVSSLASGSNVITTAS